MSVFDLAKSDSTPKDKPLVISYLRWSSGQQRDGDSERRQLQEVKEYLEKNDYEITEDYVLKDDAKSAFHSENFSENGALGKFVKEVKLGNIPKGTVLIIEDFSRFSRAKVRLAQERFLQLINNGIRVYIAKDQKEYNEDNYDTVNMIVSLSKMTAAHEESDRKSNHLKSFWQDKRKLALENTESNTFPVLLPSNAPDWLSKVKGVDGQKYFHVIEERAAVIQRIFFLADKGGEDGNGLGSTMIVRILDSEGVKPFVGERKNTARTFNDGYITRLLRDKRLIGELQPYINPVDTNTGKRIRQKVGEHPIQNYFPPIIDKELFDRVADKIEERKFYQSGKVARKFSNLFTKIGKCSYCGSSMTLFTKRGSKAEGGKSAYLQCSEGTKFGDKKRCGNKAVRYFDTFEKTIINSLVELDLNHLFIKQDFKEVNKKETIKKNILELKNKIKSLSIEIRNATKLQIKKPDDEYIASIKEEYILEKITAEQAIDKLNQELLSHNRSTDYAAFKNNLELVLKSIDDSDEIGTYTKRRAINTHLQDIIQYIAIDGVKQQAWIVFDINLIVSNTESSIRRSNDYLVQLSKRKKKIIIDDNDFDFDTYGFNPAHVKVKLVRYKETIPDNNEINLTRTSFQYAPSELIKINKVCNDAINRNFRSLKRQEYKLLTEKDYNNLISEIVGSYSDEEITIMKQQYDEASSSNERKEWEDKMEKKAIKLYGKKD